MPLGVFCALWRFICCLNEAFYNSINDIDGKERDMKKKIFLIITIVLIFLFYPFFSNSFSSNLIYNGDFEEGNTGFSTDYHYSPGAYKLEEGAYDVVIDPKDAHIDACSFGDHTSGKGLMMAVNGATTPNKVLWSQYVTVNPDIEYQFSGWFANWSDIIVNEPVLRVFINDNPIATFTVPTETCGVWQQFTFDWNFRNRKCSLGY